MLQIKTKNSIDFPHKKKYLLDVSHTFSLCSNCNSAVITEKSIEKISTIKPLKYHVHDDIFYPCFLLHSNADKNNYYRNEKAYNKIRQDFVKTMKSHCKKLDLSLKTFFTALEYFDRICSSLSGFDLEPLYQVCDLCIILSSKLNESINKAIEVKHILSANSKRNYATDELFVLQLLNYDLIKITSYDILIDILKCGFIFNDEEFHTKKLNSIYDKMESMLYLFSENKNWIFMTPKEIAMGIVGWARNFLGLAPFSKSIQTVFLSENDDVYNYIKSLNKIKKCFKIKESKGNLENNNQKFVNNSNNNSNNSNNSDSTKDSNSDCN